MVRSTAILVADMTDSPAPAMTGKLHLHPISETHQLRPTLTYMDILTRKTRRRTGADSDEESDDGPPPDPDEPAPAPAVPKKERKAADAKEVQVAVRRNDDKSMQLGGGLTATRREMLMAIRAEEDERWEDVQYYDGEVRSESYMHLSSPDKSVHRPRNLVKHLNPSSPATKNSWNARLTSRTCSRLSKGSHYK